MTQRRFVLAIALVASLVLAGASMAAQTMKHSGSVVVVDEPSGTLVMHEVGPWKLKDGETVLTTLTIALTKDTQFAVVSRDRPAVPGTLGPFVERPIGAWAISRGDFVTVDCRHEGDRLIGTKVTVTYVPAD